MVILPSSSTSAPGSFFTSSSSAEPSGRRYAELLYTKVSATAVTSGAWATITAPSNMMASLCNSICPILAFGLFRVSVIGFITGM